MYAFAKRVLVLILISSITGICGCNRSPEVKERLTSDIKARLPPGSSKENVYRFIADEGIPESSYFEYSITNERGESVLTRVIVATKVQKRLGIRVARVQMRFYLSEEGNMTNYEVKEINTGV